MAQDIDLGKISITPKGSWTQTTAVEYNDIWKYKAGKFLALKDSIGIVPVDDGINWYELSTQGLSAYQVAQQEGYVGTIADWLASLRQPAIDAAAVAISAVATINTRYLTEIEVAKQQLANSVEDAVVDKVVRPVSISAKESKAGSFTMGGDDVDIYERSITLDALPKTVGETKTYTVADEPLGYGLYLNVESFVATGGKSLTGSFFNTYYEIVEFTIDANLNSLVTVRCIKAVNVDVKGILHLQYCKFYGDIVEFDIALPSSVNKQLVTLEFPKLKFNKKMAFSYITDDSYSIYQYIFAAINKRKVITDFGSYFFHYGMDDSSHAGYVNPSPLQCSDGGGIKRRYATTVACWPKKLKDQSIGQNVGPNWLWMSEKEFKFFRDFGFMVGYHDLEGYTANTLTQASFDECVNATAAIFNEYVGMTPKLMIEPNGDHNYIHLSKGNDIIQCITAQSGDVSIKKVYPFKTGFTLDKNSVSIERLFAYGSDLSSSNDHPQYAQDLLTALASFNSTTNKDSIYWLIGSAHRSSHWESVLFETIYNLYGDQGLDNLWLPTLDEMYEYWFMTTNTIPVKTITDTGVHYKLYIPKMPNFFYRDLSVLLSGISRTEGVSLSSGNNVYGSSLGISDGKLLVNVNFDEKLLARAEKYVSDFETNYNQKYVYDDAYYFVQQLKPGLKEGYLARLNVWVSPPVFSSMSINSGQSTSKEKLVTLALAYSGQAPTEYLASENEDFSTAAWKPYASTVQFELSEGFNLKTIYVKLRNIYGSSAVKLAQITFVQPDLVFHGIVINNGNEKTTDETVSVKFNYTGYPAFYWLSENASFAGAQKLPFVGDTVSFKLSSGYGNKTVYAKLDDNITVSQAASDSIELIDAASAILNSIQINNGDGFTASGTVQVLLNTLNEVTKYKLGTAPDLSAVPWINLTGNPVLFNSGLLQGALTVYAQVANEYSQSEIKNASITVVQPVILSSMQLASGAANFSGFTVPVSFQLSQGAATHYRLAESSATLATKEWLTISEAVTYTFTGTGDKILYGQVKNQVGQSSVVSDSVVIKEPPVSAVVCLNTGTLVTVANTIIYPVTSVGDTINVFRLVPHTSYSRLQFKSKANATLPWYVELNTTYYAANTETAGSGAAMSTLSNFFPALSGNTGVYPDEYLAIPYCSPSASNNGANKGRIVLTLPPGTYEIKLLMSVASGASVTDSGTSNLRANCFYSIYEGSTLRATTVVGPEGFTGINNVNFNAEMTFTVESSERGNINLYAYNNGTGSYRPSLNLFEIIKLN